VSRPVIGISTASQTASWGPWTRQAALTPLAYVNALGAVGAVPVLLPPVPGDAADVLERVDALVLSGGVDIDPAAYGRATGTLPDRDRAELDLLQTALDRGLPVLGICRGMQLLNVGLGGDLIPHLPDEVGSDLHRPTLGAYGYHPVGLHPDSRVGRLLGERVTVPTHHHQGVGVLGKGLAAVGWADDGVVEALELDGDRFVVGVLWHPEESDDRRLFEALVAAATRA
jgi:putative glutamine amidotransferase